MYDLTYCNTYRIKSFASKVYLPESFAELRALIIAYPDAYVIGNGSNIILDRFYNEAKPFIILGNHFVKRMICGKRLIARAGSAMRYLSEVALHNHLSGLEVFYDIPASLGGALWMNASAYGNSIYDHIVYVVVFDLSANKLYIYHGSEIEYGYRYSMFQDQNVIILAAAFDLYPDTYTAIADKMNNILEKRLQRLPREPSGGSVFKRSSQAIQPIGAMIEKCGLKGLKIGGAQISKKHGGVIINTGTATQKDIRILTTYVQLHIKHLYGLSLEMEQIFV